MPTIRIDDEVYKWLQSLATAFEDNPNSVLRRVAGLDEGGTSISRRQDANSAKDGRKQDQPLSTHRASGRILNERWGVGAKHSLYHHEGTFYNVLLRVPGALFDPNGYVVFRTEEKYLTSPYLRIGERTNVNPGISSIPGYKKIR